MNKVCFIFLEIPRNILTLIHFLKIIPTIVSKCQDNSISEKVQYNLTIHNFTNSNVLPNSFYL